MIGYASKPNPAMSDTALLAVIGRFIKGTRINQNRSQQQVAEAAGINRSTLAQIERGRGGTLLSFLQVMRAIDQLQMFNTFEISEPFSPIELAKLQRSKRQRASKQKAIGKSRPKSDW
jgi:transcriptional regulator with XRE-family HTH domain